jgi:glycerol-3-phosphate dehydrogenase
VYGAGLWLYDLLAGGSRRWLDAADFLFLAPRIARDGLGGFRYRDARADDARLSCGSFEQPNPPGPRLNYVGVKSSCSGRLGGRGHP